VRRRRKRRRDIVRRGNVLSGRIFLDRRSVGKSIPVVQVQTLEHFGPTLGLGKSYQSEGRER